MTEIIITIKIDGDEVNVTTEKKEVEKVVEKQDSNTSKGVSQYARWFDDGCPGWTKNPEYNLVFLKYQQDYANSKLKAQGYLFLNDVYDMLDIPRTNTGQVVGWIYDAENPIGDNFVDFGLNRDDVQCKDFVNGYRRDVLLDFNVDGTILDLI